MTTVAEQANPFLSGLAESKRNKARPATVRIYESYLRNWIVPNLGTMELSAVRNKEMREFVNFLVANKKKPSTINGISAVLKALVRSETDGEGNRLHSPDWNTDYIDAPRIESQEQPSITALELNIALRKAPPEFQNFYALQAGSGLRMGEMRALRMGPDTGTGSFLDMEKQMVIVRSQIYGTGKAAFEQPPKSAAGIREVDVYPPLVEWLKEHYAEKRQNQFLFTTRLGTYWHVANIYGRLEEDGIPGTHSLRRFRTTHMENLGVPRVLVDYWTGHAGTAITDRYTQLGRSIQARRDWGNKVGIGFDLPRENEDGEIQYLRGADDKGNTDRAQGTEGHADASKHFEVS